MTEASPTGTVPGERRRLLIVAGPNGSGKTTVTSQGLAHEWFAGCEYINPDVIARDEFGDWNDPAAVLAAAKAATARREACLAAGRSFTFETMFSGPDKVASVGRGLAAGWPRVGRGLAAGWPRVGRGIFRAAVLRLHRERHDQRRTGRQANYGGRARGPAAENYRPLGPFPHELRDRRGRGGSAVPLRQLRRRRPGPAGPAGCEGPSGEATRPLGPGRSPTRSTIPNRHEAGDFGNPAAARRPAGEMSGLSPGASPRSASTVAAASASPRLRPAA